MNPLYLGTRDRRLFAIHEPAAAKTGRARAAVLCYPWGSEYVYAHRSMRQLASRLSQAGYHTLRFDFFGTGDSSGELVDADLAGWEADATAAVEGIKDIAGASRVSLIGLRIGATVAAKTAARLADDIDALVMWDPIVNGAEYLRTLDVAPADGEAPEAPAEVNGFALSGRMRRDFRTISLREDLAAAKNRSLVLMTERPAAHGWERCGLPAVGGTATLEFVEAPTPWLEAATMRGAVPVRAIQRIVEWLA